MMGGLLAGALVAAAALAYVLEPLRRRKPISEDQPSSG